MVHLFTIGDRDVLMVIFKLIYTTIWTIYKGLKKKEKKEHSNKYTITIFYILLRK